MVWCWYDEDNDEEVTTGKGSPELIMTSAHPCDACLQVTISLINIIIIMNMNIITLSLIICSSSDATICSEFSLRCDCLKPLKVSALYKQKTMDRTTFKWALVSTWHLDPMHQKHWFHTELKLEVKEIPQFFLASNWALYKLICTAGLNEY